MKVKDFIMWANGAKLFELIGGEKASKLVRLAEVGKLIKMEVLPPVTKVRNFEDAEFTLLDDKQLKDMCFGMTQAVRLGRVNWEEAGKKNKGLFTVANLKKTLVDLKGQPAEKVNETIQQALKDVLGSGVEGKLIESHMVMATPEMSKNFEHLVEAYQTSDMVIMNLLTDDNAVGVKTACAILGMDTSELIGRAIGDFLEARGIVPVVKLAIHAWEKRMCAECEEEKKQAKEKKD